MMRPPVLGRDVECATIDQLLEATSAGLSGALVLRGDAGMGKTTLLEHAIATAEEFQVLRLAGIESEAEFGFSALHRLLLPFLGDLEALPGRQRAALESAFGLAHGPPADRFIVGLAALSLLANAAQIQPLVCLVDDAQWLDRESLDALTFVARRVGADRVALLFAVRGSPHTTGPPFDGLPVLAVEELRDHAVIDLLSAVANGPISDDVGRAIVETTRGCPLAVVELARSLTPEQFAGVTSLPDPLPITGRLERLFVGQVRALPEASQRFLLLAAVDASAEAALLWRAAAEMGLRPNAADAAVEADLIALTPRVEFRHPLIRSAVLIAAGTTERRQAHAVLASVSIGEGHADQRAWHLAAAAFSADEVVAMELERGGERAAERGRYAAEAAFYERAAALTPDRSRRAERLLAAARAYVTSGSRDAAIAAVRNATPDLDGSLMLARAQRLQAILDAFTLPGDIPSVLLDAAQTLEALDIRLARDTYAEALEAVLISAQLTARVSPAAIARVALAAPPVVDETFADVILEALGTLFTQGYVAAVPSLRRGVALAATEEAMAGMTRSATAGQTGAAALWDVDGYGAMLHALEPLQRERGALDNLRITLGGLGYYNMWTGRLATAEAHRSESVDITRVLGENPRVWELLNCELFAYQGRDADTRAAAAALTGNRMVASGAGVSVNQAYLALAILELSQGHYAAAFEPAWKLYEIDAQPYGNQTLAEVVEAGARSGRVEAAHAACARLEERAHACGMPWAFGLLARSRALLASDGEAEQYYGEAIDVLSATVVKTDLARAHLLYGEWLRRQEQRTAARAQLETAHEMFAAMGAALFSERARLELAATGVTTRRRETRSDEELTGQEYQVAQLAADGATNKEIAATLFISAATVEYHLRKVYRKLNIASRRQLQGVLPH